MIYMVEMALLDTARRAEWDAWYVAHQHRLLAIPGIRAGQRFEAIHSAVSPFVALHEVASADVFTSPAYRAHAGPNNTGEWQAKMNNWHRNLFARDHTPDVPMDARLVVSSNFAVCIRNGESEADLVVGKIYRIIKPEANDRPADIRVLDESGEDYLYPRAWFVPVALPLRVRKALVANR